MPRLRLIPLAALLALTWPSRAPFAQPNSAPAAPVSDAPSAQATPPQPARPSPPPRIGVRLDEGPAGEWRIAAVVPLSPAHRAGLKAGDLILKVRGEAVFFDDPEGFREAFRPNPVHLTVERNGEEFYFVVPKRVFEM